MHCSVWPALQFFKGKTNLESTVLIGEDNVMDVIRVADLINDEKMFRAGIEFIKENLGVIYKLSS